MSGKSATPFAAAARALTSHNPLRNRLYLVKSGVPWDVAMSIDEVEAFAYCIILGEMEGGKYDWDSMKWQEKK